MDTYLTPEQVAKRLLVRKTTVYTWLRNKKIKGKKIGKLWRIPEQELEKKLNSGQYEQHKKLDLSKWHTGVFKGGDITERYDREYIYSDTDRGT
jgi:excisionase family DNA binding protein